MTYPAETIDGKTVRIEHKTADTYGALVTDTDGLSYRVEEATGLLVEVDAHAAEPAEEQEPAKDEPQPDQAPPTTTGPEQTPQPEASEPAAEAQPPAEEPAA